MEINYRSKCFDNFKEKYPESSDQELESILDFILRTDPEQGINCGWLIDSYMLGQLDTDNEETIRTNIENFKILYGRRPFPKNYTELKKMNDKKLKKGKTSSSTTKKLTISFTDCKSFFDNVRKTFPEPYKSLPKEDLELLYEKIVDANPTSEYRNCIWIVNEMKRGNIKEAELPQVREYLKSYFSKVNMPLPNFYPNFPVYSNYDLVKDFIDGSVDLLSASDFGVLLVPLTKEASCHYGAQTSWCTSRKDIKNAFMNYALSGVLIIWFDKKLNDKYQFFFESERFKDKYNKQLSFEFIKHFRKHPVTSILFKKHEDKMLKSKEGKSWIFPYLKSVVRDRWPEAEELILETGMLFDIVNYAKDYVGRWPEVEELLLKSRSVVNIVDYARDVIKGRWPEAEELILETGIPDNIREYSNIIEGEENELRKKFIIPEQYEEYEIEDIPLSKLRKLSNN